MYLIVAQDKIIIWLRKHDTVLNMMIFQFSTYLNVNTNENLV